MDTLDSVKKFVLKRSSSSQNHTDKKPLMREDAEQEKSDRRERELEAEMIVLEQKLRRRTCERSYSFGSPTTSTSAKSTSVPKEKNEPSEIGTITAATANKVDEDIYDSSDRRDIEVLTSSIECRDEALERLREIGMLDP